MAITIHLPKLGMTMEEGDLLRWLVPDGARVERGLPIFEMETEKVEEEVEAEDAGVLKQLVAEGTTLEPGAIIGCLLGDGESEVPQEILDRVAKQPILARAGPAPEESAAPPSDAPPPAAPTASPPSGAAGERILATPIARRLATEHGIDLARVTGTGPNGRITESDIRHSIESSADDTDSAKAPAAPAEEPPPTAGSVPYRGRRRVIGQRLHTSLQTMAQLTLSAETRVDAAMSMLHGINREWRSERVVATLTALVVKACALALREHPRLNSRLEDDHIVIEPEVNVGVAVDLDEGLMVPVVRGADALSLQQLARAVADLTKRAKENNLSVDDVSGGTFTVTSLEGFTVDAFTPVINLPQAAILGVGRVREVPVLEGSRVERGQVTTLSLTFDHRVVDGAPAARFLARVCELLDRPYMLI